MRQLRRFREISGQTLPDHQQLSQAGGGWTRICRIRRRLGWQFHVPACLTTAFLLVTHPWQPAIAQLVDVIFPTNPEVLFQTSGPARGPGVGDWYTTATSASTDRLHRFFINITQQDLDAAAAAGGQIQIGVRGGQSNGGDDEVNGRSLNDFPNPIDRSCPPQPNCDPTRFTVRDANNSILATQVFPSGTPDSPATVFFYTVTTPGVYQVTSETGALPISGDPTPALNDDDNSFEIVLRGAAASPPLIGQTQGTFQRNTTDINAPLITLPFFFLVGPDVNSLFLRNFDLDVPNFSATGDVEYFSPTGGGVAIPGTPSGNAVWNNGGDLNTGGDTLAITPIADAGIWQADFINYNASNQTLFEANTGTNNRLVVFDATPSQAGNFTAVHNRPPVEVQGSLCYDIDITNLFFTSDIVNLRLPTVPQGYTFQFRASDRTTVLPDTDGDGNPDTAILAAFTGSRTISLCATPAADAPNEVTIQIEVSSFMDQRVRGQLGLPPSPPVVLQKQISRDSGVPPENRPSLRLVKRITNVVRNGNPLPGVNFAQVIDDPGTTDDNASGWSQIQLQGITALPLTNPVQSNDEVTYRVYFLSDGTAPALTVNVCDLIPGGTTYVPNTAQIQRGNNSPTATGDFFSPLTPLPLENSCPIQENPNGALIVNLGDVSNVAGDNFGFIQFRVRVN